MIIDVSLEDIKLLTVYEHQLHTFLYSLFIACFSMFLIPIYKGHSCHDNGHMLLENYA